MPLYKKSKTISDSYMRRYIDEWDESKDSKKLYKFLYLLIKDDAKKRNLYESSKEIEAYSETAARMAYDDFLSGKKVTNYFDYKVSIDEILNKNKDNEQNKYPVIADEVFSRCSIHRNIYTSKQIKKLLSKLPKRINSSESMNIEVSVVLTLINRIGGGNDVILYHVSAVYIEYIRCVTNIILLSIGDSYHVS